MKRTIKYIQLLIILVIINACTNDFAGINTDPNKISNESLTQRNNHIGSRFSPMFSNVIRVEPAWNYQLQHNLNADVFSGYMTSPTPFAGNINNQTYALVNGWNGFIWSDAYNANIGNGVMPYARGIKEQVELTNSEGGEKFVFLANIIKVMGMHRVSDVFGPIRYSKYDDYNTTGEYDSQENAYKAFFMELDEAIVGLKQYEGNVQFDPFDESSLEGDIASWRAFANSLRLRLAIRVSKVDQALAKIEGEKALASDASFITGAMTVDMGGFSHPLATISGTWGDICMSAEMEAILKGFNDVRIAEYFNAPADVALGTHKGVRQGIEINAKSQYGSHSLLGNVVENATHKVWMTNAEVHFLKAEAALRGWSGAGNAKMNYEEGVRASFSQHGASDVEAYLADNTSTPADFVDALNTANDIAYASDVKIAYDNAATQEEQLEQIITQKWIAMFPDGQEAWSEFRRTGYPRVFPVVVNNSGGDIDTNTQVRRINFVDSEKNTNAANVTTAVGYLNGPDTGGTRLWWDTGMSNF
ncbi:RagB/SusD family nutrient uptake outer membrane protein [Tenacibaculum ovolyticum]|uniref:RagB/SusD family nutrient uptake outer membrane protein n=1 Tax=Tenacibaculum ovolyticum TaxID=104270 RepID=UPI0022F3DA50|nr:RagB/SusD family nutrient uptake outer membrane protein [Tenacibaculum ovolyticum]WBX75272.1 RagB/SusD family nutrient uptake outer membrane protein [Tenacibaculum ovolyticum]